MDWSIRGTWSQWLRRLLALSFGVAAVVFIRRGDTGVLVAFPLGILGAVLALPELLFPFTWLIDVLFGTASQAGRPPLDLRLARSYVKQERWEEAYEEYERVSGYHPGVEEPYVELLKLGARLGRPERQIDRIFRKGMRRIRDEEGRLRLRKVWEEARILAGNQS
jgi:hypothetical protein